MGISDFFSQVLVLLHQALHLASDAFVLSFVLLDPLLALVQLLEGLRLLSIGKPDVLLSVSHLFGQARVLLQQLLHSLLQGVVLLVVA